jgi:cysteine desulfurase
MNLSGIGVNDMVYADHAATTAVSEKALAAMLPYLREQYGNPSGIYKVGREARQALNQARETVARAIGAQPEEIYFTSGGSEADNWALKGVAELKKEKGRHIITTQIEHHALLNTAHFLEEQGFEVTYLPVDMLGRVSVSAVEKAIREDTILISVMTANNEIGTIQPIAEIGAVARKHGILFHTDGVQAVGHIPVDVEDLQVDLLSLSGHKFGGPKGVGALYMRKGLRLPALIHGGGQEKSIRGGTENVAGCVGMAAALEESVASLRENMTKVSALRDRLINGLLEIPFAALTGDPVNRLPGIASFVFECVEGESMVLMLDYKGICASSGSACSSGSLDPSHVLMAIGLLHEVSHGSLRLSLGADNTEEDVDYILEQLPGVIARLRQMSPLWEAKQKEVQ